MKIVGESIVVEVKHNKDELLLDYEDEPALMRLANEDSQVFISNRSFRNNLVRLGWAKYATEDWLCGTKLLREEVPRLRILFAEIRRRGKSKDT